MQSSMIRRRTLLFAFLFLFVALAIFWWQLPAVLQAMPSRYVARLPEPIQELGRPQTVEILPTAAYSAGDAAALLETAATVTPTLAAPATPTPPATADAGTGGGIEASPSPSETPAPTATPSPEPTATRIPLPAAAQLGGIRYGPQDWNNCGPATLVMALTYFDVYHTQTAAASVLKPSDEDRNVSPEEMAAYVNEQTDFAATAGHNGDLYLLRRAVTEHFPVIVEVGDVPTGNYTWIGWSGHYLLVVGYDDERQMFLVYDTWLRPGNDDIEVDLEQYAGREISYEEMDETWRQFNRNYVLLYDPVQEADVGELVDAQQDPTVKWQENLARAQQELSADTDNAYLWFNLGTAYTALAEYDKAALAFDQARGIGLPRRMLYYQFGPFQAYFEMGRYEDVITLADVFILQYPFVEEVLYYKGLALAETGQVDEAIAALQTAAEFNPNFTAAADALRELREATG